MNVRTARLTTNVLVGICAVLCLSAVLQYAGVGRGYRWLVEAPDAGSRAALGKIDREPFKLPPENSFAAIEARPLFNDDRKPTPAEDSEALAGDAAPATPLNVTLTGVIVTPEVRIALVRDNARNQSVALKVGMPLEGDQAGWILTAVKPRSAVFKSAGNEESEIELETAAAPGNRQVPGRRGKPPANQPKRPASRANGFLPKTALKKESPKSKPDLAKRIEERRRELRENAERLRKQRAEKHAPTPKK